MHDDIIDFREEGSWIKNVSWFKKQKIVNRSFAP